VRAEIIDREFSKFTEVNLSVYVHHILWRLRDHPDFPAPTPTLNELREKLGEMKRELTKLLSGDDRALDSMQARRSELERIMKDLADNLEETTHERAKLGTTGFDLL
jgi:predicted nuclease with TOPRIM domain